MTEPSRPARRKQLAAPKGTRDFYPEDLLRRRYIEKAWRDTSIRHGFEEIEGPTFETAELYKVKSGEGILGEMFGVFSGKAEEDLKHLRETGEAPLALRPEFTPTLARMYAARAAQLPKPTKWFTAGPYFRAEKPQRGRLREFCQWNVDSVGGDAESSDVDILNVCVESFVSLGLGLIPDGVRVGYSHRGIVEVLLTKCGIDATSLTQWFEWLDNYSKHTVEQRKNAALAFGANDQQISNAESVWSAVVVPDEVVRAKTEALERGLDDRVEQAHEEARHDRRTVGAPAFLALAELEKGAVETGIADWLERDTAIVRGLAYYTGMVFEAIAEGERAVCGGGRYDNLIELFGGPATPAVGFGMGDVVLGNLLQDKGLMPEGPALLEALSAPAAGLRPDVFVIPNGSEEADGQVRPLVARLRRGLESEAWLARDARKAWDKDRYAAPPLHARHSYKATKNIGKLLEDARKSSARFAAVIENVEECSLKNLDTGEQRERVKLTDLAPAVIRGG